MLKKLAIVSFLLFLVSCGTVNTVSNDYDLLKQEIENKFTDTLFAHAHWGVLIKSLDTDEIWYERNSDKMFMPASNEKILTTSSALTKFGPDYKFKTILKYYGVIEDSALKGDLIVWGNGDPTFYTRLYDSPTTVFESFADFLISKGIYIIDGNLIGDDNAFDDQHIGNGWPLDGLSAWYFAEVGPLQVNENYVDLEIIPPGDENSELEIIPNLESKYYTIKNEIILSDTGKTRVYASRDFGTNEIVIKGNMAYGSKPRTISPTITNPTKFYVTVLKETFERKGIEITGKAVDCDDIENFENKYAVLTELFVHNSKPLNEIIKVLMKKSQNVYAETYTRLLGWEEFGLGSFENGRKVVQKQLNKFGINENDFQYSDGSGLSRYNFVSPKQIVKILEGMKDTEYWQYWIDALPVAGVDGTLKSRMKGTRAEGNVKAKTGTIANVRGLSGYITTESGENLVFSFLINGHLRTSKQTEQITDSVLELISNYSR
ncbi:MAG: D-alanyl-D-alanine carboxypeptidase/D-alanyl-D-alanine-endopeptidase [Melioribacteraceae bacterium]|nr:D-alanyl-D-alanine carboxypeptidase/D-alanyl-D-alanine-endopeptidase [Melioribacteraceae bacterium]